MAPSMSGMSEPTKECVPIAPSVDGMSEPTKECLECLLVAPSLVECLNLQRNAWNVYLKDIGSF